MSALADYKANVKARGWIFLDQLPANTPLGKTVAGAPGARSPWSPSGSKYEIAPYAARIEQGWTDVENAVESGVALAGLDTVVAIENVLQPVVEATGLDHGLPGLVAKTLGVQPWVILVALVVIVYFALVNYKVLPSPAKLVA